MDWDVIEAAISAHADGDYAENWEWDEMWVALHSVYPVRVPIGEMREQAPSQEELTEIIYHDAVEYYEQREAGWGDGADAQHRAVDHAERDRHAVARAPRQHGLHAPGHRAARATPRRIRSSSTAARARRCSTRWSS